MATPSSNPTSSSASGKSNKAGVFFLLTLVLWLVSVLFEILINRRTELVCVLGGICFFQLVNRIIRFRVSRNSLFVNTSVSLLHSIITSSSVVFILVNQWRREEGRFEMFEHSQLFEGHWPWAYQALCFSSGYFAYDQWDMIKYRLYSGLIPSILVHHLVLLICFTLALYRDISINYLILTLICELHSVFLHIRKLRRMAGIRDSKTRLVKLEWVLNWTTFVVARVAAHVLITIRVVKDARKFGNGIELPLALFGMAGMNVLNVGLGVDLFSAFRRERRSAQNDDSSHSE